MVNHDPEASEDDRDSPQDEELIFLRERVETYELEIERMRSENIARESEKRRLAEMVKSLSENRTAGSEAGAREERVCSLPFGIRLLGFTGANLLFTRICGKTCWRQRLLLASKPRRRIAGYGMSRFALRVNFTQLLAP
jgi:hypothetical protein